MEKKILFLDYDGVLFDTLKEVYLVCRKHYKNISMLNSVDENEYHLFSKYKYLCYNIWMFYYYDPIIFNCSNEAEIEEKFFNALKKRNFEKENLFCDEFLKIRADLVRNNYDFWKNLEQPFEFFQAVKNIYQQNKTDVAIVSKKNKQSILERFELNGFEINPNMVFAREFLTNYSTKGEFLSEFLEKNNYTSAIFVDDNINNINTNKNPKIKNILALWGNTAPYSKGGYSQKEAIELINNYCNSR